MDERTMAEPSDVADILTGPPHGPTPRTVIATMTAAGGAVLAGGATVVASLVGAEKRSPPGRRPAVASR